jgi:hypothetical protein
VWGGHSHVFDKKIPWQKRKCERELRHDAKATSFVAKVWGEVFTHFNAVTVQVTVVCGSDNPPYVKENDEHALDYVLHLPRLLQSR